MLSPLSKVLANITLAHCDAVGEGASTPSLLSGNQHLYFLAAAVIAGRLGVKEKCDDVALGKKGLETDQFATKPREPPVIRRISRRES